MLKENHGTSSFAAGATQHHAVAQHKYLVIDLKSFYASVECVARGLDPMTTDLVVADTERTNKTICLAVSPSLKAQGVRNRCRLFEIPDRLLAQTIIARPRMRAYIERSADIYAVYLRYLSPDDIHVYSIDEAFLDVTGYLALYGCTARELGERIREDVVRTTGIPATCGLGTNLYLAKVALDISAKHRSDFFGELNEISYRETLWNHRPLTDFWRVGPGTARRLAGLGITTMGQLALSPQEPIYKLMGIDAEILIDHAWGIEPVTMAHIKAYRSKAHSLSNGQVLSRDYTKAEAYIVAREMCDALVLSLVRQQLLAGSLSLAVGYALTSQERSTFREQLHASEGRPAEHGLRFAGAIPSNAASMRLEETTNSYQLIMNSLSVLYERVVCDDRPLRRIQLCLGAVVPENQEGAQLQLFSATHDSIKERRRQEAINAVKDKFGKNALLKGMDFMPGATARERNAQIGGHRSG